jgi:endonuclease YncB( thermonuclease family)
MWDRRAKVLAVKDGDTLKVQLDQGFGDTKTIDLRLYQAFAPEHDEPGGPETREFVEHWLDEQDPDGDDWPITVTTVRTRTDHEVQTLGRYVGVVMSPDGKRRLNDEINKFVADKGYGRGIGSK